MNKMFFRGVVALFVISSLLTGCGALKKFTGQRNDTILPGERENILTPDQQVNNDISTKNTKKTDAGEAVPCDPTIEVCPDTPKGLDSGLNTGIDQEAGAN